MVFVVAIGAHLYTLTTLTISGVQYVIEEGVMGSRLLERQPTS